MRIELTRGELECAPADVHLTLLQLNIGLLGNSDCEPPRRVEAARWRLWAPAKRDSVRRNTSGTATARRALACDVQNARASTSIVPCSTILTGGLVMSFFADLPPRRSQKLATAVGQPVRVRLIVPITEHVCRSASRDRRCTSTECTWREGSRCGAMSADMSQTVEQKMDGTVFGHDEQLARSAVSTRSIS